MSSRLIRLFLLLGLLASALPVAAQGEDPPPLRAVATDEIGRLALFYPEDWLLTVDESGFSVRDDDAGIAVSVQLVEHDPLPFDELPEAGILPEGGALSRETYSGFDSWLMQGEGLFRQDVYSAVVALALTADQSYVLRGDFPPEQLAESAAVVTAMLDKLVILPASVTSEGNNLSVQLPLDWVFGSGIDSFLAATDSENLRAISREEVPRQIGVMIRFASNTSLEDQLSSPTALAQSTSTFDVNGVPITLVLRQDNISGAVEVVMVRPRSVDSFLTMRAVSADADLLISEVALLQAIFASVQLQ